MFQHPKEVSTFSSTPFKEHGVFNIQGKAHCKIDAQGPISMEVCQTLRKTVYHTCAALPQEIHLLGIPKSRKKSCGLRPIEDWNPSREIVQVFLQFNNMYPLRRVQQLTIVRCSVDLLFEIFGSKQLQPPRRVLTSPLYFAEPFRIPWGLGTWLNACIVISLSQIPERNIYWRHIMNFINPEEFNNPNTHWIYWRPQIVAKLPGTFFRWRNILNQHPNATPLNHVSNVFAEPFASQTQT